MTLTRTRLTIAAAAACLGAAALLLFSNGGSSPAHAAAQPELSTKAVALQTAMSRLWEDHITWTRMVIVDFAAGSPSLKASETRLLRNQADIGNAIKPYYGNAAGNELTQLLRTHILEAVPVLQAAKDGSKPALAKALAAWNANASQIAAFLSSANPKAWSLPMMQSMMKTHLALTAQEGVARIAGNWKADVAAYDKVHDEILQMSQMLSDGIVQQFPERF
jgi:hypothetical protein